MGRWSDVQQEVSQRGLQGVECEVQEVERDDSNSDGGVGDLKVALDGVESGSAITKDYQFVSLWVPVTHAATEAVDEEGSDGFAIGETKCGAYKDRSRRDDPISATIF